MSADEDLRMLSAPEGDLNTSPSRADRHPPSAGAAFVQRDADAYFHQVLSSPCLDQIVRAEGPWIETADGRRLLDFHGNSVHQVGFAHPVVREAISRQIERLPYCTRRYTNDRAVELAESLIRRAPGQLRDNARVLLTPSGSAGVGIALKIARAVTGRHKTIAFHDSFHGATLDSAAVGGQELFQRGMGPILHGSLHTPRPCPRSCEECKDAGCIGACAADIEQLLDQHGDVAAVIAEPIRSTTVRVIPTEYWRRIRAACDRHGTLLIFDEIPTCLGRSGAFWASEHAGVTPDLIVLGKGLGGGVYPQAAVLGRAEYNHNGVVPVGELALGHYTHEKSPVGCAAALATIGVIDDEALVERSAIVGRLWAKELSEALRDSPHVREVRSIGLMVGVELTDAASADRVMYACLDRGLSFKVGGGDTLVLFPPLTIDQSLLERATRIIAEAIRATKLQTAR